MRGEAWNPSAFAILRVRAYGSWSPTTSAPDSRIARTTSSSPWVTVAPYQMLNVITVRSTGWSAACPDAPVEATTGPIARARPTAPAHSRRLPAMVGAA